jgi:hypothetical protein
MAPNKNNNEKITIRKHPLKIYILSFRSYITITLIVTVLRGKFLSNEDEFSVFWANKLTIFFNISNQELFIKARINQKKRTENK